MSDADGEMDLVAFGFARQEDATAVERELRTILDVDATDLGVHAVGGTPDFVDGARFIVAGRIRERRLAAVHRLVKRHDGKVLTDVPEAWS